MYVVREVLQCKPGKIAGMIEKFTSISEVMREMGYEPFRLLTDVSGERFWTIVAESTVETIDEFFAMEQKLMNSPRLRQAMAGYHDLVERGRREIYRLER
jgi:hypothetical protein